MQLTGDSSTSNLPVVGEVRAHLYVCVGDWVDDGRHHRVAEDEDVITCTTGGKAVLSGTVLHGREGDAGDKVQDDSPWRMGSLNTARGRRMMSPSPCASHDHHSISSTLYGRRGSTRVLLWRSVPEDPRYTYSQRICCDRG